VQPGGYCIADFNIILILILILKQHLSIILIDNQFTYLGKICAIFVFLKEVLQFIKRTTSSRLHCALNGSLGRLINCLGLLVNNRESLFVRGINDAYTLAMDQTGITVTAQIVQIVRLLHDFFIMIVYYHMLLKAFLFI
jgi:hypothetical protein